MWFWTRGHPAVVLKRYGADGIEVGLDLEALSNDVQFRKVLAAHRLAVVKTDSKDEVDFLHAKQAVEQSGFVVVDPATNRRVV